MTNLGGLERVTYLRDLTFAIITPLEFLYPQAAYCEASLYSVYDTGVSTFDLLAYNTAQIVFNVIRKLGTISLNGMIFWDCFNKLDGNCAGITSGRFWYYFFDFRNFYYYDSIDTYDAALTPLAAFSTPT